MRQPVDTLTPPLFREVQRFRQWFLWVPVAVVTVTVWYEFYQQIIRGNPQGAEPIPNLLAWVLTIVFGLGFPIFAAIIRLVTEVRPGALLVRLVPFRAKIIPLAEIDTAGVRDYSPMKEFGGWGIRISRDGKGKAYNAYGKQGVQLTLKDGKRILIGSQRSEELLSVLRSSGADID